MTTQNASAQTFLSMIKKVYFPLTFAYKYIALSLKTNFILSGREMEKFRQVFLTRKIWKLFRFSIFLLIFLVVDATLFENLIRYEVSGWQRAHYDDTLMSRWFWALNIDTLWRCQVSTDRTSKLKELVNVPMLSALEWEESFKKT